MPGQRRRNAADVAERERRMRVRRADHAHRQHAGRVARPGVGAEALVAAHLGRRVEPGGAAADRVAALGDRRCFDLARRRRASTASTILV